MGYAFISYSTKNQSAADAMRQLLRKNGVDTWMAPYDIPAGSEYAEVLYDALTGCACLVLLLTGDSQNSLWVKKEVNIAISNYKTVIPVKLEDMELNSAMKLYLNDQQIVPVHTLDEDSEDVQKVLKSIIALAGQTKSAQVGQVRYVRQVSSDGDVYEGDLQDGKRTGKGKLIMACGSSYEGDFLDGKRHGRGIFRCESYTYEGDFADDDMHGKGKMTCADGSVYEGDYRESWRHGTGRLLLKDGDVYEGDFVKDRRTGRGKLTRHDGCILEGYFEADAFRSGTETDATGNLVAVHENGVRIPVAREKAELHSEPVPQIRQLFSDGVYEGDCVNGQRTGKGKFTWNNGDVYEGDFVDGKRHGKGKYTWARGTVYEGDFWNGQRTGKGKFTRPSGETYEGDFVNGKYHGMGRLTHVALTTDDVSYVYEGPFVENKCTGKGKITYPNGNVYEGDVVEGKRHGSGVYTWNAPAPTIVKIQWVPMTPGAQPQWLGGEKKWDTGWVYRGTYEKDSIRNGKVYDANGVLKITYVDGTAHYEDQN